MKIESIFPSPIAIVDLDLQVLNEKLRSLFLKMEKDDKGQYNVENKTSSLQKNIFESTFDLFKLPFPEIQELKQHLLGAVSHLIYALEGKRHDKIPISYMEVDAWFHITRSGGYISAHTHPMASWSGVYYIDPGYQEIPPQSDDNGVLRFIDTRTANMYQDRGNIDLQRPFNFGSVNIPPTGGRLVIFPSYLQHEASPYVGEGERICVAFNISIPMSKFQ